MQAKIWGDNINLALSYEILNSALKYDLRHNKFEISKCQGR